MIPLNSSVSSIERERLPTYLSIHGGNDNNAGDDNDNDDGNQDIEDDDDDGNQDFNDDLAQLSDDVIIKVGRVKLICFSNSFRIILWQLECEVRGVRKFKFKFIFLWKL